MKRTAINKLLYEARIKKGVTIKEAASRLSVSRFKLDLIEKGYLYVPRKKYDSFIHYYNLADNFFDTHSTYVKPLEEEKIDYKTLTKKAKKYANKKVRIISYISIFTSLCCIAFGIYANNRRFLTPRIAWTQEFTSFTEKVKSMVPKQPSLLEGDYIYKVGGEQKVIETEDQKEIISNYVTVYEKDTNSESTNIDSKVVITSKTGAILQESDYYLFASNKKKVIFFAFEDFAQNIKISQATILVQDDYGGYGYYLRPFQYKNTKDNKYYKAKEGSDIYKTVDTILSNQLYVAYGHIDTFLQEKGLIYERAIDLLSDIQKISRDSTLFSRLGISFISVFSFTACVFAVLLGLSYYCKHKLTHPIPKLSKETKEILNYKMTINEKIDDIRYPSFIPEFGARGIGLIILLFSSITLFCSVYLIFNANFIGFSDFKPFRDISANLLSAAILLLFFIKLDVYSRKNATQLLTNIIILFVAGLVFYIVEVLMFNLILKDESIFSSILVALSDVIPGNIIWNIMLYSLIFYFLNTVPYKYLNYPTKIIKWRLCSLIPTFILIFALFYKFFFEPKLGVNAIYISLMFHTSGIIITLFAIFYIYALYFYNLMNKFNYGVKDAEWYSYSRRYALYKNIIASVIIFLLFALDMFFRYNIPDNNLKLGKNWAIILLIPIIMLYRPHIGRRNVRWDNIYTLLYGAFLAGGYVSVLIYVLAKLNIAEIIYIRF